MPTEYETRGTCVICGRVRSLDWMDDTPVGPICEGPPSPIVTEGESYRPAWEEFNRTHSKEALVESAVRRIKDWDGDRE